MEPLDRLLRNKLEKTIKEARDIAESAATISLQHLGVGESNPPQYLKPEERELRKALRVHGRQLGDARNSKTQTQEIDQLVEEVAYQHWHRMLFARFLAENNLLMYPGSPPVAVSLEECEELAAEEGAVNGWEIASRFAANMLPQIFIPDSPIFKLQLPPEKEQSLEEKVSNLPKELFTASDALGWIYQFWQSKRKDDVNKAEIEISARELPAVTQLFTEPYMVNFLLDNSIGAWWAHKRLSADDLKNATTEDELRNKAALPGTPLKFLRFIRKEQESWEIAASSFEKWPVNLRELKIMDPCCGSGHFLVATLLTLVPMYMELESLTAPQAIDFVLSKNIHGLELDKRCVELAAFALAFTAWRYPNAGGYRPLPQLNIACSGLSLSGSKDEWKQVSQGRQELRLGLEWMHDAFSKAPILGSLLDPEKIGTSNFISWGDLSLSLENALKEGQTDEQKEAAVMAYGLSKSAMLLTSKYHLIATNVPYLARGKQDSILKDFCEVHYCDAKNDLATVFLQRCLELCCEGGTASIVLPQNWLFLTTYKKLRENLLKKHTWHSIARLGEGGFDSKAAAGAFTILLTISRGTNHHNNLPMLFSGLSDASSDNKSKTSNLIHGIDVSEFRSAQEKARALVVAKLKTVDQEKQLSNPDARVAFEETQQSSLLSKYASALNGMHGADSLRFRFCFWEIADFQIWHYFQCTQDNTQHFGGKDRVFFWPDNGKIHRDNPSAYVKGESVWKKSGVVVSMMRQLPVALYSGDKFDISCSPIIPKDQNHLTAIWCFCSSPEYSTAVRRIDQKLNVTNATLVKVPFDLDHWTIIAKEKYPNGLPKPYSDDPTQWIFHGNPARSEQPLQVAVARLLGFKWPAELDKNMDLSSEARELTMKCKLLDEYVDDDGIACIPSVRGESSAADRLHSLLATAYGSDWSNEKLAELLKQSGHEDKSLESWLREKFFTQHCTLFQHRPFIWHIWDGMRDGFAALVNYHKFDKKLLETLIYTYLGDWISRQKEDIERNIDGAQEKLAAAELLQKNLILILKGEQPYDIFVRWKSKDNQPLGWEPDLNDGIRLNIRPFMAVPDIGKRGAGILRDKPNINWNKDRGKDVESAPWFSLFKGDRINDHHLSLTEKQEARSQNKEKVFS